MKSLLYKIIFFLADRTTSSSSLSNSSSLDSETNGTVSPIYDFLDTFGPVLIGILLGVGTIYCIILGVQYARAEKGEDRDVAKKKAINAGISFGVIILLVFILYAMRGTFIKLLSD